MAAPAVFAAKRGARFCSSANRGGSGSAWTAGVGRRDRDRVRRGNAAADHGRGRCVDSDCRARRAGGEGVAVMIAFPAGVRVWLATGHTDMRRGFEQLGYLLEGIDWRMPQQTWRP